MKTNQLKNIIYLGALTFSFLASHAVFGANPKSINDQEARMVFTGTKIVSSGQVIHELKAHAQTKWIEVKDPIGALFFDQDGIYFSNLKRGVYQKSRLILQMHSKVLGFEKKGNYLIVDCLGKKHWFQWNQGRLAGISVLSNETAASEQGNWMAKMELQDLPYKLSVRKQFEDPKRIILPAPFDLERPSNVKLIALPQTQSDAASFLMSGQVKGVTHTFLWSSKKGFQLISVPSELGSNYKIIRVQSADDFGIEAQMQYQSQKKPKVSSHRLSIPMGMLEI